MIGGSCYLVDTGKERILIDFGLYYGKEDQEKNKELPFDPTSIDAVLVTHAHIDHIGRLPVLYKFGFKGNTYGIDATKDIAHVMLKMSMSIAKQEKQELYDEQDLDETFKYFKAVSYGKSISITRNVKARFVEAGHILGSSMIELTIQSQDENKTVIVFTGDLGNKNTPLLKDPTILSNADYVLVESTYGIHKRNEEGPEKFTKDVVSTLEEGGSVLIPAFVLEKTQKVIYLIGELKRQGKLPRETPVYIDSLTAQQINFYYRKYKKYYDPEAKLLLSKGINPLFYKGLIETSGKETLKTHHDGPAIYITASGMLEKSNAPKHLAKMAGDSRNLVAIVGWQAPDSTGRKLQNGEKEVFLDINGKSVLAKINARVERYSFMSSHADGPQILQWLSNFPSLKQVYIVHGEPKQAIGLSKAVQEELGFSSYAPKLGEKIFLFHSNKVKRKTK